jgi:nucleoside-diphosphate-sugar epimerase
MKILFVGGTGTISLACTRAALKRGYEVYHLNRGTRPDLVPDNVRTLIADIRNQDQTREVLKGLSFNCLVNWVGYIPDHVRQDIEIFGPITDHYVFISSASVYQKPPVHWIITESTPVGNPFWQYARDKIDCERALLAAFAKQDFPCTIVRPSHTYSDGWVPTPFGSRDYTVANRMLQGEEVISTGDGQSLWTLTHSDDFARGFVEILGNQHTLGEIYHITSDEAMTWDNIYHTIGGILGVEPKLIHIPSDFINKVSPSIGAGLLGDKAYSTKFDNTKIKNLVPGFEAVIPFHEGIKRSLDWIEKHPEAKIIDEAKNQEINRILEAWSERK